MSTSQDLETSLKTELASVKKQLDSLTVGQAALERIMSQVHKDVGSLVSNGNGVAHGAVVAAPQIREKPKLTVEIPRSKDFPEAKEEVVQTVVGKEANAECQEQWKSEGSQGSEGKSPRDPVSPNTPNSARSLRRGLSATNQAIEDRRIKRLEKMFEVSEAMGKKGRRSAHSHVYEHMFQTLKNSALDIGITVVIMANAVFIGLQVDDDEANDEKWNTWMIMDVGCSLLFWFELIFKLWLHGFRAHYWGPDRTFNTFDSCLVFLDTIQQILTIAVDSQANAKVFALVRIIRLVRLAKILRVLRTEYFKNLLSMIHGMLGGIGTLAWSVVLFLLLVYVMSVLGVDIFKKSEHELIAEHFASMPRAMFTVFRCSFGDCNSMEGTSLPELIGSKHGWAYSLIYCAWMFFTIVGLFNVISAIFVEATLQAATELALKRQHERLCDEKTWAWNASTFIRRVIAHSRLMDDTEDFKLSERIDDILQISVNRSVIEELTSDKEAVNALLALEIDAMDHKRLSDILDPDHSGTIDIMELTYGLQRLRGQPRRSDIVTVDLMVRNLQEKSDEILHTAQSLATINESVASIAKKLEDFDASPEKSGIKMQFGHHAI